MEQAGIIPGERGSQPKQYERANLNLSVPRRKTGKQRDDQKD
jgi:hypothetical protein